MLNAKRELVSNRKMETSDQIDLFEQALNEIFAKRDFNDFESLINGFDDKTENEEVMFSLIHALEYFAENKGGEVYINKILSCLKLLNPHALDWAELLMLRIINDDTYYDLLRKIVAENYSYDTDILKLILKKLIKRNPDRFSEKCNYLFSFIK